ncbi:MAG: response regulator transcription factor [Bacteroidota bacterium]
MKKRILVVDDERDIVDLLRYNLGREGYDVVTAYDGQEALRRAADPPDLVLLDVLMPVMDGFETCKQLKANPRTASVPVLFLTASASEVDEVLGLELGADDYIQKPISPRKLLARVKTALRRSARGGEVSTDLPLIRAGGLEINRSNFTVRIDGKEVFFPRKEFEVLSLLASHPGRVFTRERLLHAIWGSDVVVVDRTIDVHIRKIREKLGDAAAMIETIKGVGYRFKE